MKIILFAGSLRKDSLNKKLIKFTDKLLKNNSEIQSIVVDLQTLNIPVYDGDIEANGIPGGVQILAKHMSEASAIIISSPEYNGSISSPLKNTIDWLSRVKPNPMTLKSILLLGASPGVLGATRGLAHTRQPIETLGNYLYPVPMGFMHADQAFDEKGNLKDPSQVEKLQQLINSFIEFASKLQ
jgi:chromate reductase